MYFCSRLKIPRPSVFCKPFDKFIKAWQQATTYSTLEGCAAALSALRIVGNPVPPDETQTVQDEPERHEVVRLLFECSSGERTPDFSRFSSNRVTIRPQRPVREVLVQASVRGIHTASPARSRFP